MLNRRLLLRLLFGAAALPAARAASMPFRTKDMWGDEEPPKATIIKGKPVILDFGDGLKIPMDKSAFLTLWEGKTFWMTYGAGREEHREAANGEAVHFAESAMKLLLLTLAFAPERLERIDGGWRLKQQKIKNYVRGDIDLPGKPFWPINDTDLGVGDADTSGLNAPPDTSSHDMPWNGATGNFRTDSFTAYYVRKKDVDLDYVRAHAHILME
jgi:hypothetical protein